jgi:hypothetical protein
MLIIEEEAKKYIRCKTGTVVIDLKFQKPFNDG